MDAAFPLLIVKVWFLVCDDVLIETMTSLPAFMKALW